MAAGLEITREDPSILEKKVELLDVPEQDIEQGIVVSCPVIQIMDVYCIMYILPRNHYLSPNYKHRL